MSGNVLRSNHFGCLLCVLESLIKQGPIRGKALTIPGFLDGH